MESNDITAVLIEEESEPNENHANFQYFNYDSPRFDVGFVVQKLKWSFAVFCVITGVFYAVNASFFNHEARQYVFNNLKFLADWRLLIVFIGVYITFATKKSWEINNVSLSINFYIRVKKY